ANGADDPRVPGRGFPGDEQALDRALEIVGLYKLATRVADASPDLEGVGPPAVGRRRQRDGEIRDELCALDGGDAPEADETVVREDQDRPGRRRPRGRGIDRSH